MTTGRHFKQGAGSFDEESSAPMYSGYDQPGLQQDVGSAYDNKGVYGPSHTYRGSGKRRKSSHGGARKGLIAAAIVVVILLVAAGASGFLLMRSAKSMVAEARAVVPVATSMKDKALAGDYNGLLSDANQVSSSLGRLKSEFDNPLWKAAEFIPVYGGDVSAARKLVAAASDLTSSMLQPLAQNLVQSGVTGDIVQQGGSINIPLLQAVSSSIQGSYDSFTSANKMVQGIGETHISQVTELVDKAKNAFSSMAPLIDVANEYMPSVINMLGANGQTRTYLVIAQNNAELRSTGGLPGSWGTLSVTDGKLSIGEFESVLHKPNLNVSATEEEKSTFTPTIATDPAQENCTPDFSRVGVLSSEYWQQLGRGSIDGAIAIDPIFLQRLLGLVGGFTSTDGRTIDGTNAAKALLSDTYWLYGNNGDAQDAAFAAIASEAFGAFMDHVSDVDISKLYDLLSQSARDGRLLVWMADEQEENLVDKMGMSGKLSTDTSRPVLGVYTNDDTYSKISWYTSVKTTVGAAVDNADGTKTYDVQTAITNTIDSTSAANAPVYIVGNNPGKRDRSDMRNWMFLFAPAGGSITDLTVSDGGNVDDQAPAELSAYGFQVYRAHLQVRGGETVTLSYKVTVSSDATEPLAVRSTPLAQEELM